HHRNQGGAARDRPHRRVLRIERRDRLAQRSRLGQLEWHHVGDILSMLILRQPREEIMFRSLLFCLAACLPLFAHGQTDPIRIGFLTVRSGALAAGGKQMEEGIQLYLKERNYTFAGRKVEPIIADDFAYGHETAAGFQRVFEDHGGRVVQKLWPPLNVPDYGSYIAQIKPNVDAVYAGFAGANGLRFLKQYKEYGMKQPVLG